MNIADIPLFSMLRSRLGYLTERERVVAQNIANADTPGFAPKDLTGFTRPGPALPCPTQPRPPHPRPRSPR